MNTITANQIARNTMVNKTIGIEIECFVPRATRAELNQALARVVRYQQENWNTNTRTYWKAIRDGSLVNAPNGYEGAEFISPPLKPVALFEQLEKVLIVLNEYGAKVRKSCGFHIHCDAKGFTPKRLQYALNHYVKSEQALDRIMAPSRRNNNATYCKGTRAILDTAIDGARVRTGGEFRYRKLNLTSYAKHGTLEFRHHGGTLDFAKMVPWIAMCQATTERCRLKVTRTPAYNNPMHNVLVAIKWAKHNLDGTLSPVTPYHNGLIKFVIDRMNQFGYGNDAPTLGNDARGGFIHGV